MPRREKLPARRSGWTPQAFTLEERLHRAHDQFVLLADLFGLQAVMSPSMEGVGISPSASSALTQTCRDAAADLRDLLDTLPAALTNWTPAGRTARPHRPGPVRS